MRDKEPWAFRHPAMFYGSAIVIGMSLAVILITWSSWTISREYHEPCTDTLLQYIVCGLRQLGDELRHLW